MQGLIDVINFVLTFLEHPKETLAIILATCVICGVIFIVYFLRGRLEKLRQRKPEDDYGKG